MQLRRLIGLLTLLATPALATEYHVRTSSCSDTAGQSGASGAAFCSISYAVSRAVANDTITVHAGSYSSSAISIVTGKSSLTIRGAPAEAKPVVTFSGTNGLTTRADNTIVRDISWGGISCGSGNFSSVFHVFYHCTDGPCTNPQNPCGSTESCMNRGFQAIGNTITVTAQCSNAGSEPVAFWFDGAFGKTIDGNTVNMRDGDFIRDYGKDVWLAMGTGYNPDYMGAVIRGNVITFTGTNYGEVPFFVEAVGRVGRYNSKYLIYNNDITTPPASGFNRFNYYRESAMPLYMFNNRIRGSSNFYHDQWDYPPPVGNGSCGTSGHPPCTFSTVYAFNNTVDGQNAVSDGYGDMAYGGGSHYTFKNNIVLSMARSLYYGGCGGENQLSLSNSILTWRSAGCKFGFSNICQSGNPSGCGGISYTPYLETTTGLCLASDGSLCATSTAIGQGTNDPLLQGPGTCVISANSTTYDCSLDANGVDRGTVWDIGWKEFSGSVEPPNVSTTTYRGAGISGVQP